MRFATPHFTSFIRCAEPTPIIDEDTTCVVLIGNFNAVNPNIIRAEDKSVAAPFAGFNLVIFPPIVLIIFQPPIVVPIPMAIATLIRTQNGIFIEG